MHSLTHSHTRSYLLYVVHPLCISLCVQLLLDSCLVPLLNPPTLPSLSSVLPLWSQRHRRLSNGKTIKLLKIHNTDAQNQVDWNRKMNMGIMALDKGNAHTAGNSVCEREQATDESSNRCIC